MNIVNRSAHLTALDRQKYLSSNEQEQLNQWVEQLPFSITQSYEDREQKLRPFQRLIQPIKAVFAYCNYSDKGGEIAYACCVLLLKEMQERKTALWAWDQGEWLEIVGISKQNYFDRYSTSQIEYDLISVDIRKYLISFAYLLGGITIHYFITDCDVFHSAQRLFSKSEVAVAIKTITEELIKMNRLDLLNMRGLKSCVCLLLLVNKNPLIENITVPICERVYNKFIGFDSLQSTTYVISQVLFSLGIITQALDSKIRGKTLISSPKKNRLKKGKDSFSVVWLRLLNRWCEESPREARTVESQRSRIAKAARWATANYPVTADPQQWTGEMAKAFVEAVEKMTAGEYNHPDFKRTTVKIGKPLCPAAKAQIINAVRCFFTDCQIARYIPCAFQPSISLQTPTEIIEACGPRPQVIADELWDKLEEAALSLTQKDLPLAADLPVANRWEAAFPLAMVRALAHVWVFGGLRSSEIWRLEVGCIRWLAPKKKTDLQGTYPRGVVGLQVPENKSGGEFEKSVDARLGSTTKAWEKIRPDSSKRIDKKSGKLVHYLFEWHSRVMSQSYINNVLIPILCRKAQISEYDVHGHITCHRGRATLATRLYRAGTPFKVIQQWLDHASPLSTAYYLNADSEFLHNTYSWQVHVANQASDYSNHLDEPQSLLEAIAKQSADQEEAIDPEDDFAHLRLRPRRTDRELALLAQSSLALVQQNMLLSPTERQIVGQAKALLNILATRS